MTIPPFKYCFSDEDIAFVTNSLAELLRRGDYLSMGRYGEELEAAFAAHCGARAAVAVNSCSAGLEIILRALNVAGGDVVVPTMTFAATAMAAVRAGARPIFVDCDEDLQMSVAALAKVLRERCGGASGGARSDEDAGAMAPPVKACLIVHNGGFISPRILEIVELCRQYGVPLVEDAAHAHGSWIETAYSADADMGLSASSRLRRAGSFGVAAAFSFFSTKVLTSGEGGLIVTNDENLALTARSLRNQGVDVRGEVKFPGGKKPGGDIIVAEGLNARLSEAQALLALAQTRRLNELIEKRRAIAAIYDEVFTGLRGVRRVQAPTGAGGDDVKSFSNLYKYVLVLENGMDVSSVREKLRQKYKITLGGNIYETPCHRQPVFAKYLVAGGGAENDPSAGAGGTRGEMTWSNADQLCSRHICPPIYPQMTREEAIYCAQSVREVVSARSF